MSLRSFLLGSLLLCLAGCRHAAPAETEDTHVAPPAPARVAEPPKPAPPPPAPAPARDESADLEALFRGTVLTFDFEEAQLKPESRERLQRIAEAMRAHPSIKVQISGNCDERGTEEFNLVLGQKRAEAARKYLVDLGIEAGRVSTVSYGKERPADPNHTDEAWARNRRDELAPTQGL